jgi:hypothetical protein
LGPLNFSFAWSNWIILWSFHFTSIWTTFLQSWHGLMSLLNPWSMCEKMPSLNLSILDSGKNCHLTLFHPCSRGLMYLDFLDKRCFLQVYIMVYHTLSLDFKIESIWVLKIEAKVGSLYQEKT